jgi:hypothetical protein
MLSKLSKQTIEELLGERADVFTRYVESVISYHQLRVNSVAFFKQQPRRRDLIRALDTVASGRLKDTDKLHPTAKFYFDRAILSRGDGDVRRAAKDAQLLIPAGKRGAPPKDVQVAFVQDIAHIFETFSKYKASGSEFSRFFRLMVDIAADVGIHSGLEDLVKNAVRRSRQGGRKRPAVILTRS